jgi:hypothetical protein
MFQVGIDGFILSQSAELFHPSNESLINSCAYSYSRCLEDLAFCLVYADKILKYGDLRPPLDAKGYSVPNLLAEIQSNEESILGQFLVDKDIHGDQLLEDPYHKQEIVRDLKTLEQCVRSQHQPRYKEWMAREASIYFGEDKSVFEENTKPSEYKYETTVKYHTDREIQDSIEQDVVQVLDSALLDTPKGSSRLYSAGSRKEFITRNMLTLVTIMRAYELAATRNNLWRMPHVTRACLGFQQRTKNQGDLRRIVVRHALYQALRYTEKDFPESIIRNLFDLRSFPIPKKIRELLNDLLIITADEGKEARARNLIREIKQVALVPDSEQDSFVIERRNTFRELDKTKPKEYDELLCHEFPVLGTNRNNKHFFIPTH